MVPHFKEITQMSEYDEGQRSGTHILWCWTLFLMRHIFSSITKLPGFFELQLHFLHVYESRILKVLRFPGYTDANARPIKYSLAVKQDFILF